ncbi:MAG TPA: PVC-type heme-binding CxxCH protein, partial [Planctomycetaceae bacterium]|nr:PVC-type heme-binding CxxCH protein [Planctomycetaceae bacterium]
MNDSGILRGGLPSRPPPFMGYKAIREIVVTLRNHRRLWTSSAIAVAFLAAGCASWALAADFVPRAANQPKVAEASNEGELAIQRFRVPKELQVRLYAAEPMVANPVAFCFDEKGRVYVAETFRQGKGVEDNRGHMHWLDDDLAAKTVEDRLKYFQKHLGDKLKEYSAEDDRIRLLEDRDGDGKADHATVFAEGFNGPLDGTGAGLLARRGSVYYTCIPNLWLLKDTDGDGKADVRESLSFGYGVRVAFRGHDSHGLRMGPDGRIYFSIGDRGYHIESEGRVLAAPDRGAVFRCNPDGTELEVFATGLRNPQELAFDQYGNLFTGDNNSDSGDRARWVHVVEGGDTGWRMYYQYLNDRGPWNREKLWHPQHEGQPAYIVPPIVNLGDGPSGLAYYPGVGLPERYNEHFFMCDFRGGPANSGVRSFAVKPKGASFELVDSHEFLWSVLVTDCDFGYDGGFYFSDWVDGWNGQGKGRIYKAVDPELLKDPKVAEVGKLMAEGFSQRSPEELARLLRHPDMRIRQEAQFALAERGPQSSDTLLAVAKQTEHQLARLHAIWGLGQIGRKAPERLAPLLPLLQDGDVEVRAQVANVLGDARPKTAA